MEEEFKIKMEELEELLESGDRQAILDCLMTYNFQTRDEAEMCEKLRNKEYELRMQTTEEKLTLSEQWEKDAPLRIASVKYMSEHPLTHEQMMEQKRRNEEIRRKNVKEAQQKEKDQDKSILSEQWEEDAPLRMASVKYMSEHPLSHEEWMERKRRNEEIRRKNEEEELLKRQK